MMVIHEETFLNLKEDMFKHVFTFLGKVEFHSGIIFNGCRLAALIEFLQVITREHKEIITIHSQLCPTLS